MTQTTEQFTPKQRDLMVWCLKAARHVDPDYDREEYPELEINEHLMGMLELGKRSGYTVEELERLKSVASEGIRFLDAFINEEFDTDVVQAKGIESLPENYQEMLDLETHCQQILNKAKAQSQALQG